jgi:hypothetical protein
MGCLGSTFSFWKGLRSGLTPRLQPGFWFVSAIATGIPHPPGDAAEPLCGCCCCCCCCGVDSGPAFQDGRPSCCCCCWSQDAAGEGSDDVSSCSFPGRCCCCCCCCDDEDASLSGVLATPPPAADEDDDASTTGIADPNSNAIPGSLVATSSLLPAGSCWIGSSTAAVAGKVEESPGPPAC